MNSSSLLKKTPKEWVLFLLKILATLGLIYFILKDVNFKNIGTAFASIPVAGFFFAAGVQLLIQIGQALRWKILVGKKEIPYKEYFAFVSLGQTFSLIAPSVAISDGLKAYWLGKRNKIILQSISSLFLGRVIGISILLLFLLFSINSHTWLYSNWSFSISNKGYWYLLILVLLMGLGLWKRKQIMDKGFKILKSSIESIRNPLMFISVLGLSGLIQVCQLALVYIGYYYVNSNVSIVNLMFFVPIITLLALVPLTIGQIGVREGLSVISFTQLPGVLEEHVLAVVAYSYVLSIITGLINLGLAFILLKKNKIQNEKI